MDVGVRVAETDLRGLFLKHARTLQGLLTRKVRDPELAADLVQESFLRLAEQQGKEAIDNTQAYLYRTAHNLLVDHIRQQQRRRTDSQPHEALMHIEDDRPALDDALDSEQRLHLLRLAMADLPPRTQQIFQLNRVQGLTHSEVARQLEISDSSVQKHLAKALAHITERLQQR
jgi:RNA polymerase sigma-70 factor (ECF subfamily)